MHSWSFNVAFIAKCGLMKFNNFLWFLFFEDLKICYNAGCLESDNHDYGVI